MYAGKLVYQNVFFEWRQFIYKRLIYVYKSSLD